jgi:hypothetical protein
MQILTTDVVIPKEVLDTAERFAERLGERLQVWQMPTSTHVSVSTSGCFERSQTDFGIAAEVSSWVTLLKEKVKYFTFSPCVKMPGSLDLNFKDFIYQYKDSHKLCDPWGELIFPRTLGYYMFLEEDQVSMLDILYASLGSTKGRKVLSSLTEGKVDLPPKLGKIVLLMAQAESLKQGSFVADDEVTPIEPYFYMTIPGEDIRVPIFASSQMSMRLTYQPSSFPKTMLTCLAEPGAKTRPLGKNQAWFTMVTRAMRFMAEPILSRDGRARIGLRSTNKMWSFLKFIQRASPEYEEMVCQSTDYRSATDLIPLPLIKAMWTGFLRQLPHGHPFHVYASLMFCQRELFGDKKFEKVLKSFPDLVHRRGSFMGEPMSFLTLTLENLLVEEITNQYYSIGRPLWTHVDMGQIKSDPSCICGDDVAALRSNVKIILLFREVVKAFCWALSWKDLTSKRCLIFCEDHCLVQGDKNNRKVIYIDVIKSRLLTTMTREHSENRSSILGKGRMLSNQLDYFENKFLKIAVLGYFARIFNRAYNYNVIGKCKFPLYLPPSCGGLGLPIVESVMPEYMYPYIGYVYSLLGISDFKDRFLKLTELGALNTRAKHGIISTDRVNFLAFSLAKMHYSSENKVMANAIYDDDFVMTLLEEEGIEVQSDPYTKKYDFSAFRNAAAFIGFVPFSSLPEEIERVLNFSTFFSDEVTRQQRTYNQWVRDSRKFWNGRITRKNKAALFSFGREKFTSIVDMERAVLRSFSGWIYVGEDRYNLNLINTGPSLKIDFRPGLIAQKKDLSY